MQVRISAGPPGMMLIEMTAADHAHGGGRGKSKGNRHPVSPWGTLVSCTPISFPSTPSPHPHPRRAILPDQSSTGQIWIQDSQEAQSKQVHDPGPTTRPREAKEQV